MKYIQNKRKHDTKNNTARFPVLLRSGKSFDFCQQSDDYCFQFLGQLLNLGIYPRYAVFPLFGFCVVKVPTWIPAGVYKTRRIVYGEGKIQSFRI